MLHIQGQIDSSSSATLKTIIASKTVIARLRYVNKVQSLPVRVEEISDIQN